MRYAVLLFGLVLAGCEPADSEYNRSFLLGVEAKDAVSKRLKDPDSAVFDDLRFDVQRGIVCGRVNAKNSFGAMTGASRFIYRNNAVLLEDDLSSEDADLALVPCINATRRDLLSKQEIAGSALPETQPDDLIARANNMENLAAAAAKDAEGSLSGR